MLIGTAFENCDKWKGRGVVYCIAILADQEQEGQDSAEYIRNYCTEKNVFPLIETIRVRNSFLQRH